MRSWTVLVTSAQLPHQPPIADVQAKAILDELNPQDAWIQYPPASGRGHGFETRWWHEGTDAGEVAVEATARYLAAVQAQGVDVQINLIHVASAQDRLSESVIGLERRIREGDTAWNVMLRAVPGPDGVVPFSREAARELLELFPGGESSGTGRAAMVEVRVWIDGVDAVDAALTASQLLQQNLEALGFPGWTIVRAHATSPVESARAAYLGVEERVLGSELPLPVVIVR